MEGENDRLSKEVSDLQEQMKSKATASIPEKKAASNKTSKSSEQEINKLKNELMEKNKEIQHLNEALNQAEKNKSKVVIQRSRSLEGESALDLKVHSIFIFKIKKFLKRIIFSSSLIKRQLQLVEQEATILRTKTLELETENEKMTAENRRLQLRVSRKPPATDSEKLLLDKIDLEERIKALEKKLTEVAPKLQLEAEKSPRLGRSTDRSGRLSPNMPTSECSVLKREKEILERDLKSKEEQLHTLTLRVQQMEKENENLHHRIEMKANAVKRVPKKPSETMTKLQLKVYPFI